jgi:hypothetical protein
MLKYVNDEMFYNGKKLKVVVSDLVNSCKELNELDCLLSMVFEEVFNGNSTLEAQQVKDEVQEILDEELYIHRFVR